jgi:hypothetical protein
MTRYRLKQRSFVNILSSFMPIFVLSWTFCAPTCRLAGIAALPVVAKLVQ